MAGLVLLFSPRQNPLTFEGSSFLGFWFVSFL